MFPNLPYLVCGASLLSFFFYTEIKLYIDWAILTKAIGRSYDDLEIALTWCVCVYSAAPAQSTCHGEILAGASWVSTFDASSLLSTFRPFRVGIPNHFIHFYLHHLFYTRSSLPLFWSLPRFVRRSWERDFNRASIRDVWLVPFLPRFVEFYTAPHRQVNNDICMRFCWLYNNAVLHCTNEYPAFSASPYSHNMTRVSLNCITSLG